MLRTSFLTLVILFFYTNNSFSNTNLQERILCKKWKLTIAQINKTNIPPRFDDLIINFKQNKNTYQLTINDTAHQSGVWKLLTADRKLLLNNEKENITHSLDIKIINKNQISIQDFRYPEITLFFAPIKNKKQTHLSPKEHLICRSWNITESSDNNNLGTLFEFFPDNQFVIYAYSYENHFYGNWKLSENQTTLVLTDHKNNQVFNLKIRSINSSSLILYNPKTNKENTFHNHEIIKKDRSTYKKLALLSIPIILILFSPNISNSP